MNHNSIFSKTDAGLSEVKTRSSGFPIRLRQLLIMIDGQKCVAELLALQPDMNELNKQLQQLMDLQLIVEQTGYANSAASLPPPIAIKPITAAAAPAQHQRVLPSANSRQKIRRIIHMTDQAYLSNKLEFMLSDVFDAMTSYDELQFCIDRWQKALKEAGHSDMADAYLYQVKAVMAS
ncbi:hypothetical protein [Deefgea sp. CFH1-16]|uniref:hypothetical protein n=1 Tax=Deefgea sp. CFH1-16 TaxID=2675457 RepID=UPI0015F496EA|nr:hypothetical protein [Deefgea sp. CFH1-16]MBM5574449.1 hypothetical protein [Deefgea sp. CFH1-16]